MIRKLVNVFGERRGRYRGREKNETEKVALIEVYIDSKGSNVVVIGRSRGATYNVSINEFYSQT